MLKTFKETLQKITRVEVIGNGREFSVWDRELQDILISDEGRTLKVILKQTKWKCIECDNTVSSKRTFCSEKCHNNYYDWISKQHA